MFTISPPDYPHSTDPLVCECVNTNNQWTRGASESLIICNVFSFDKENVVKVLSTLEADNGENNQKHRQKNCQKV